MERKSVLFYAADRAVGESSSFSRSPTGGSGVVWPTSEPDFQAQEAAGTPFAEEVRAQPMPVLAARRGRWRDLPRRADWNAATGDVRRPALGAKFTQHPEMQHADTRALRLFAEAADTAEHTGSEAAWADRDQGTGRCRLGELLMELRGQLRGQA